MLQQFYLNLTVAACLTPVLLYWLTRLVARAVFREKLNYQHDLMKSLKPRGEKR